jgi:AraC-like DNA-binding protein
MEKILSSLNSLGSKLHYHHTLTSSKEASYIYGPESHSQLEILYLLSDGIEYVIDGEHYTVNRGDAIVVLPHEIHSIVIKDNLNYERMVFMIDLDSICKLISDKYELIGLFAPQVKGKRVLPRKVVEQSRLKELFISISKQDASEIHYGLTSASKMIEILIELDKLLSSNEVEFIHPDSIDSLTIAVIKYLNEHISDTLNLSDIAKKFFVSKSTLCHKFKKSMNMTLNEYYTIKKIKYAEELIKNGVSANEASFKLGYNNYLTFYYNYKRITGKSPSQSKYEK